MKFHIDHDTGSAIIGWVVPDNPSVTPRVTVIFHDGEHDELDVEAFIPRQDIVDLGLHNTGIVGFAVDETSVPGLARMQEIEIVEAETRVSIYRRYRIDRHVDKKVCLLTFGTLFQQTVIRQVNRNFALSYNFVDRHSFDTMCALVYNYYCGSVFLSGRPMYNRYAVGLNDMGYLQGALLRDPFEELAERLMLLKLIARNGSSALLSTFAYGLEPVLDWARSIDLEDEANVAGSIRRLSAAQRAVLANPMTRALGCGVDERAERRHVGISLDNLSRMHAVGTQAAYADFCRLFNGAVGAVVLDGTGGETFPGIEPVAERLMRMTPVVDLLEHDLALYSYVEEALGEEAADMAASAERSA